MTAAFQKDMDFAQDTYGRIPAERTMPSFCPYHWSDNNGKHSPLSLSVPLTGDNAAEAFLGASIIVILMSALIASFQKGPTISETK